MDLQKFLRFAGLTILAMAALVLLAVVPTRTPLVVGVLAAAIVVILYFVGEVGLAISAGIVGGVVVTILSTVRPSLATPMIVNVFLLAGLIVYATSRVIKPGEMVAVLFFSTLRRTRVNGNDANLVKQWPERARRGHFGLDIAFAVWPWRLQSWPSTITVVDFGTLQAKTTAKDGGYEAIVVVNPVMSWRWSPDVRMPLNRLPEKFTRPGPEGKPIEYVGVDPGNRDGRLEIYLEPFVHGVLRSVIAQYSYGGGDDVDVNLRIAEIRTEVLRRLAEPESPFVQLGLLLPPKEDAVVRPGPAARHFEFELEEILPVEGSDLEKNIGAEAVAARKRDARIAEADGEAEFRRRTGTADAEMKELEARRVGEANAAAAKALINAETDGIKDRMAILSRRKGVTNAAVLDAVTATRAAQAGATTILIPGIAGAAAAAAEVIVRGEEEKKGGEGT